MKVVSQASTVPDGMHLGRYVRAQGVLMPAYESEALEPHLIFDVEVEADNGDAIVLMDFVRLLRDGSGNLVFNERSKLVNRASALYGHRINSDTDWEIVFPSGYDSGKGLMALPRFEDRDTPGFKPVEVESIIVEGVECLGKSAQVEVVEKNGRARIIDAKPLPKSAKKLVRKPKVAPDEHHEFDDNDDEDFS